MREKEGLLTRLLRVLGLIESKPIPKTDMCESAQKICNHECDSCAWNYLEDKLWQEK